MRDLPHACCAEDLCVLHHSLCRKITLAVSTTIPFSTRFVFHSLSVTEKVPHTHKAWLAVAALRPRVCLSPSSQVLLLCCLHALQQPLFVSWAKDTQTPYAHLCAATLVLWENREWCYKKEGKVKSRKNNPFFRGHEKVRLQIISVFQNASLILKMFSLFLQCFSGKM